MNTKRGNTFAVAVAGIFLLILILVLGTYWMGRSATSATEEAVHSVSLLYMDELAERRIVQRIPLVVPQCPGIGLSIPFFDFLRRRQFFCVDVDDCGIGNSEFVHA